VVASRSRVLLISNVFPPQTGGSGRWLWEVYRRFPREEFVIAAGNHQDSAEFDRTHDLRLNRVPLTFTNWGITSLAGVYGYQQALRAVRQIVGEHAIESIHCGACLPDGWIAYLCRFISGIPYVCYMHGEELCYARSSRELRWMCDRVLRSAKLVIANSRNTERLLVEQWKIPAGKIRVMTPGVDTRRFIPAQRSEEIRAAMGWLGRSVVLTVGRLQQRKGQDMLIRALPQISQSVPDVLYSIVGDGEERRRLQHLAGEVGVLPQVQFRGEPGDEELIRCYQQCDLFVLPNRQVGNDIEGFGMVLLEAQACGKPVVAGASGGTAETMRVPETGRVVDCTRPDELAQVVIEMLQDERQRAAMSAAARDWVVERFDWDALSRLAAQIFKMGFRDRGIGDDCPATTFSPRKLAVREAAQP
jgi:phosphatidylinositol alpha-1,6-mannosyltransferase